MQPTFSRRTPDFVTEELAAVLSKGASFEFKPLFDVVHLNLKARKAASGGEEMLRLRAYEKLQFLVQRGVVTKIEKKYKGVPAGLKKVIADAAELKAHIHAKAKLSIREAQKGHGKEGEKGRKATS